MRRLYSRSLSDPTIADLSVPCSTDFMSLALRSSVVCLAARARSKGISSLARTVMESVADSLRASPNLGQWRRSSTT